MSQYLGCWIFNLKTWILLFAVLVHFSCADTRSGRQSARVESNKSQNITNVSRPSNRSEIDNKAKLKLISAEEVVPDTTVVDVSALQSIKSVDMSVLEKIEDLLAAEVVVPEEKIDIQPVYRYFRNVPFDHDYSLSATIPDGYVSEGSTFNSLKTEITGTHPIYRCVVPTGNDHFVSKDVACEGEAYQMVEALGFLYSEAGSDEKLAITRCYSPVSDDHFVVVDTVQCTDNGYNIEGIMGYLPK